MLLRQRREQPRAGKAGSSSLRSGQACFWLTFRGVHFTHYWLFLVIMAALSFTLVLGYTFFLKQAKT